MEKVPIYLVLCAKYKTVKLCLCRSPTFLTTYPSRCAIHLPDSREGLIQPNAEYFVHKSKKQNTLPGAGGVTGGRGRF